MFIKVLDCDPDSILGANPLLDIIVIVVSLTNVLEYKIYTLELER